MRKILTYGTFDLFHVGHLNLLTRLKSLGDELIVGVSTDEFNALKCKKTIIPFQDRLEIIRNLKCVDVAFPEENWEQKINDIQQNNISIFGMGSDWIGKFDELKPYCDVVYLPRTDGISTTKLKQSLNILDANHIEDLKNALDSMCAIVQRLN